MFVALLRGINVGGKNLVSMGSLKENFEKLGFRDVSTYINSGNVLFRAAESDARTLEARIDGMLSAEYGLKGRTVVRSRSEMARLIAKISAAWRSDPEWRFNVVFLRSAIDSQEVLDGFVLKPDIERVVYCPGTLLWSARASAVTRTAWLKLPGKPIYRDMTVRNLNTTKKVYELMQRMDESVTNPSSAGDRLRQHARDSS